MGRRAERWPPAYPFLDSIGDFVHLRNVNDPSKPIIALIFSLWEDEK